MIKGKESLIIASFYCNRYNDLKINREKELCIYIISELNDFLQHFVNLIILR